MLSEYIVLALIIDILVKYELHIGHTHTLKHIHNTLVLGLCN